jgi:CheY-like chemotaxis protein
VDGGHVLVVDDEPAVGLLVRRVLQGEHDVDVVTSGEAALDRVAAGRRYDVLLCDLSMPGIGGRRLLERLEQVAPDQAARVVLLTGGAFTAQARAFLESTTVEVLEKPVPNEVLREVVARRVTGA